MNGPYDLVYQLAPVAHEAARDVPKAPFPAELSELIAQQSDDSFTKRDCNNLSLVSHHWSTLWRSRVFHSLRLVSDADVRHLGLLLRTPPPCGLPSLLTYIHDIILRHTCYSSGAVNTLWIPTAFCLLQPALFTKIPSVAVAVEIFPPAGCEKSCIASVHHILPRPVPRLIRPTQITLDHLLITGHIEGLLRLISDLGVSESVTLNGVQGHDALERQSGTRVTPSIYATTISLLQVTEPRFQKPETHFQHLFLIVADRRIGDRVYNLHREDICRMGELISAWINRLDCGIKFRVEHWVGLDGHVCELQ